MVETAKEEKTNGMCYTAYTIVSSITTSKYLLQKKKVYRHMQQNPFVRY